MLFAWLDLKRQVRLPFWWHPVPSAAMIEGPCLAPAWNWPVDMSNPYQPPGFDPKRFQDQPYMPAPVMDSGHGYVSQVRVVAILNCVQGVLEVLLGLMLVGVAIFMPIMIEMEQAKDRAGQPPPPELKWILGGVYGVMGGAPLIAGLLRIIAGVQNFRFRSRTLGMVSFFVGLASLFSCYCAPTSIAILVYGLIVYLNPAVKAAFEMGQQGMKGDQILASFAMPRPMVPPQQYGM
jgi:hypothetical protein